LAARKWAANGRRQTKRALGLHVGNDWANVYPDALFEIAEGGGSPKMHSQTTIWLVVSRQSPRYVRSLPAANFHRLQFETDGAHRRNNHSRLQTHFHWILVGVGKTTAKLEAHPSSSEWKSRLIFLLSGRRTGLLSVEDQFNRFGTARPGLRAWKRKIRCFSRLRCVRRSRKSGEFQSSPIATKRALLASPRAFSSAWRRWGAD